MTREEYKAINRKLRAELDANLAGDIAAFTHTLAKLSAVFRVYRIARKGA